MSKSQRKKEKDTSLGLLFSNSMHHGVLYSVIFKFMICATQDNVACPFTALGFPVQSFVPAQSLLWVSAVSSKTCQYMD